MKSEAKSLASLKRKTSIIERTKEYSQAFKLYCAKQVETHRAQLVDAMIKEAVSGNIEAFKALLDRAHGKPAQAIEVGGENGAPIVFMPLELIAKHSLEVIEGSEVKTQDAEIVNS